MFSSKISTLVYFCMVAVSSAKPTDMDGRMSSQEWQNLIDDYSDSSDDSKPPPFVLTDEQRISWIDWSIFSTPEPFHPEIYNWSQFDVPKFNYSGLQDFNIKFGDSYTSSRSSLRWSTYRYVFLVLFIVKIVCYVSYRACCRKNPEVLVCQRSVLVLVPDAEENNTNEQQSEASSNQQVQPESAAKPPSYEESVLINPVPTYNK